MNELDQPLGLDTSGRDGAHGRAAVAMFGLTGLAVLAGAVAWYALRSPQGGISAVIEVAGPALAAVPPDAPVLRSELRGEPAASQPGDRRTITIIDGKTGKREVIVVGADDDDNPPTGSVATP